MSKKTYTMPDDKSIACVGGSITAGYYDEEGLGYVSRLSTLLAAQYPLRYSVYNAGISGDTVRDAWHNVISHVTHIEPSIVTFQIGVNDICIREGVTPECHRVPHLERMDQWNRILDYAQKMRWKILIIGPLPVESDITHFLRFDSSPDGQTGFRFENKDIAEYNDVLEKLASQRNIPFLRLYEDWLKKRDNGLFIDGLHPNAKGHELLARQIFEKLQNLHYIG